MNKGEKTMATLGFIGTGHMGGALARAACKTVPGDEVFLSNRTVEKAQALASELACQVADSSAIAQSADFIFLGVKPQMMEPLLAELAPILAERTTRFILVTMAAGLQMADIRRMSGGDYPVLRIMPNTPSAIGEGMILYAMDGVTKPEEKEFLTALSGAGTLSPLAESLMDAGSAVSGCGPAFVALFIEALADGGVACGLSRAQSVECAARMVSGTAKLLLESGNSPVR